MSGLTQSIERTPSPSDRPAGGPRMSRPGAGMAQTRGPTGVAEDKAAVRRTVVGEQAFDANAAIGEEPQRPLQEGRGVDAAKPAAQLGEDQTTGHVDSH